MNLNFKITFKNTSRDTTKKIAKTGTILKRKLRLVQWDGEEIIDVWALDEAIEKLMPVQVYVPYTKISYFST